MKSSLRSSTKALALLLLTAFAAKAATYSYNVYNPNNTAITYSDKSNFTSNGGIAISEWPGYSPYPLNVISAQTAGSLILNSSYPGFTTLSDPTSYEVSMTIFLPQPSPYSGGDFVQYVHASSNAISNVSGGGDVGTFAAVHLYNPTFASDGSCSATLAYLDRTSAGTNYYFGSSVPCYSGMVMRTFITGTNINVMVGGQVYGFSTRVTSGLPGVGVANSSTFGSGISALQIGPRCLTVPAAISSSTLSSSAYANSVSLHWTEPTEPADVATIGISGHSINRSGVGSQVFNEGTDYTDNRVVAATNYTYSIYEYSFHAVQGPSTLVNVTTPPAYDSDPRRTGVKPLGNYWGGAGEQIDTLSGNLNFTVPLITAQGRGGWTVPITLSYNSQQWRKDSGGVWNLGQDVGYGYGWHLMAGSLTPYWDNFTWGIDHFLFIDASGAEYRLYPLSTGSHIWTSQLTASTASGGTPQSGESIYVYYDSSTQLLHFKNGSFWYMGCTSGGTEQDGGTMYPTIMEDRNGNQVLLRYMTGNGANYTNSSARISQVQDTRALAGLTYSFTYSAADSTGIQHISSIANAIGTAENYHFSLNSATLTDPFSTGKSIFTDTLASVSNNVPLANEFGYDSSGQMTVTNLPYGGYIRWTYSPLVYSWSSDTITQMAVTNRYLAKDASATKTLEGRTNASEAAYTVAYTPATSSQPVVPQTCLTDAADAAGNKAYRCWTFVSGTEYPWANGLLNDLARRSSSTATTALEHDYLWWFFEPTQANSYIAYHATAMDEGTSYFTNSMIYQLVDAYGNATQTQQWDYTTTTLGYGTTVKSSRTYNNTYRTNCTSGSGPDCAYINAYIYNRLATSTLTDSNNNTVTLATNTYDTYSGGIAYANSPAEHDSAYSTSFTTRGNVTTSVTPGKTVNTSYDLTGTPTAANDGNGHAIAISTTSATNYGAPSSIQPNTGSANDANLATSINYTSFLGVSQVTGANGTQTSASYDSNGRLSGTIAPTGAATGYTYAFTPTAQTVVPYTTTATTNTHWTSTIDDGLGRTLTSQAGTISGGTSTTLSVVDTVYGPCACTPIGKMIQTSQPHAPGATQYWTVYSYDGLGRTLQVTLPDGASSTKYTYQGNWTTAVDPAGKWKQMESDAFGNTIVVVEPDPSASPLVTTPPSPPSAAPAAGLLITTYTYDYVNHLIGVSMPRKIGTSTVTQTRTFHYNAYLQLDSKTEPETGTTTYTYNPDGTLGTRKDAKQQTTTYGYDGYQRLSGVSHYSDSSQSIAYSYDADPFDSNSTFATNTWGRLAAIAWGGACNGVSPYVYIEEYAYDTAGNVTAKRFTKTKQSNGTCSNLSPITANFTYDSEGKITSTTYPAEQSSPAFTVTNTYDAMSRLTGVTDVETGYIVGCGANFWNGALTWASSATYNPANQLASAQFLSGVAPTCSSANQSLTTESQTYNTMGQLTEIDATNLGLPSNVFAKYTFPATTNNGQITQTFDGRLNYTSTYTYDLLKRLTATNAPNWNQSYTYDGFGNMTAKSAPTGSSEPALPGVNAATNQLTGVSYDANGNAQSSGSFALAYDMENRMVSATIGSSVTTYSYDASNRRIETVDGVGNDTFYFYAPDGRLLTSFTVPPGVNNGSLYPTHRIYFGSKLIGTTSGVEGSEVPVLADRLGTAKPGYAYGTDISGVSFKGSNDVDFATYRKDSVTGLEYANQRWFNAGFGRFMTTDPSDANLDLKTPTSLNRFAYTNNDPANSNDPTGLLISGPVDGSVDDPGDNGDVCNSPDNITLCIYGTLPPFPSSNSGIPTETAILNILKTDGITAVPGLDPGTIGLNIPQLTEFLQASCGCPAYPTLDWGQIWKDSKTGLIVTGILVKAFWDWYLAKQLTSVRADCSVHQIGTPDHASAGTIQGFGIGTDFRRAKTAAYQDAQARVAAQFGIGFHAQHCHYTTLN